MHLPSWFAAPLAAASLIVSAGAWAQAAPPAAKLVPAQSQVSFVGVEQGVKLKGEFKKFDVQLALDPKQPQTGKVAITIDLASVTLPDAETSAELLKPEWFGAKKFPQATFQSTSIKGVGAGKLEVAGKLTIKGTARDVVVPVTLAQAGPTTTATGGFAIKRLAFKIGDGDWADTSMVADEVQVQFKFAFTGVPPL